MFNLYSKKMYMLKIDYGYTTLIQYLCPRKIDSIFLVLPVFGRVGFFACPSVRPSVRQQDYLQDNKRICMHILPEVCLGSRKHLLNSESWIRITIVCLSVSTITYKIMSRFA